MKKTFVAKTLLIVVITILSTSIYAQQLTNGDYTLSCMGSNKYNILDANGFVLPDKTKMVVAKQNNGSADQQWIVTRASKKDVNLNSWNITSKSNPTLGLFNAGGSESRLTLKQYSGNGDKALTWQLNYIPSEDAYEIVSALDNRKLLLNTTPMGNLFWVIVAKDAGANAKLGHWKFSNMHDPILTSLVVTFFTQDDDKDFDTQLTLGLFAKDKSTALYLNRIDDAAVKFDTHSKHSFSLDVQKTPLSTFANGGYFTVDIDPNGHDKWSFTMQVILTFTSADGKYFKKIIDVPNLHWLSQSNRSNNINFDANFNCTNCK